MDEGKNLNPNVEVVYRFILKFSLTLRVSRSTPSRGFYLEGSQSPYVSGRPCSDTGICLLTVGPLKWTLDLKGRRCPPTFTPMSSRRFRSHEGGLGNRGESGINDVDVPTHTLESSSDGKDRGDPGTPLVS